MLNRQVNKQVCGELTIGNGAVVRLFIVPVGRKRVGDARQFGFEKLILFRIVEVLGTWVRARVLTRRSKDQRTGPVITLRDLVDQVPWRSAMPAALTIETRRAERKRDNSMIPLKSTLFSGGVEGDKKGKGINPRERKGLECQKELRMCQALFIVP